MRWFFDAAHAVESTAQAFPASASGGEQEQSSLNDEQSISEMADAFGVTMRTLRFYEEKGLLQPRRVGNRRFYNEASRARLRLILKGKSMGLGLDEIGELVTLVESGLTDSERATALRDLCERQRDLLMRRRDDLNEQIDETTRVIDGLTDL